MRTLLPLVLLLGCTSPEPAAPAPPEPAATPAPEARAEVASPESMAQQIASDDRSEPEGEEPAADPVHEAVDQAAREAGLTEWLAGDRPKVKATHRFVELQTHGTLGRTDVWRSQGDRRVDGQWSVDGDRLDLRFKLFTGKKETADTWVACIWPGVADTVRLICGIEKAKKFGTADYALVQEEGRWTLTLTDPKLAAKDDWPLVMVVAPI